MGSNQYIKNDNKKNIMKIIHFVGNLSNLRGLENQAMLQLNALRKRNIDSLLWTLTLPKNNHTRSYLINYCSLVCPSFLKPKIIFANIIIFIRLLLKLDRTIVHIHGLSEYVLPFILAKKINKKISIIVKISNSGKKSTFKKIRNKFPLFNKILIKLIIKNIDQWISINTEIRDELIKEGVKLKQIRSIPNGVILPKNKKSSDFNNSLVWFGSLVHHKNLFFLIDIIERLPDKYTLTIYGKGGIKNDLLKHAHKKGISGRIKIERWLENYELQELLHKHSIFISTSIAEGMSNSLLEAIANDLIPVCYDIPANRAVLGEDYPLIIKSLDTSQWSNKIQTIKDQEVYLKRILSNKIIKYDLEKITDQLIDAYI